MGGHYGDGELVVRVSARAVDGAATRAVLRAVADALDVPARCVTLVTGATSRTKVLDVEAPPGVDDPALQARVARLLAG